MDLLQAMNVFKRVADTGSFTRAADSLNLPRTSATVVIQQLEAHLNARLLQRTTRRLNLTPQGATYYEHCARILASVDEAEHALGTDTRGPRGRLRIDMPAALGRLVLMPQLYDFHARYPDIELMLGFGDKTVDLIADGVDCTIRIGALADSSLVARHLGDNQLLTVASPAYLARRGTPAGIDDLREHEGVHYFWGHNSRPRALNFVVDGREIEVAVSGRIAVNDAQAYFDSAVAGHGLAQTPRFIAQPYLQTGALVEVLPRWKPAAMPINALYPNGKHLSPSMRVFIDWTAALFDRHASMWKAG